MKLYELYGRNKRELVPSYKMYSPAFIGVEVELENFHSDTMDALKDYGLWAWKEDHSLRNNGMEFVTEGSGLHSDVAHDAIKFLCEWAEESEFSEGYPRAGIHAHIDCSDLDLYRGDLSNLIKATLITESVVFSWLGEWRKWCGFSDIIFSSEDNRRVIAEIITRRDHTPREFYSLINSYHRYAGTNLCSLNNFSTIEHRQMGTTFDADKIIRWINFNLRIKQFAMNISPDDMSKIVLDASPNEACAVILGDMSKEFTDHIDEKKIRTAMKSITFLSVDKKYRPNWSSINVLNPILSRKGA